MLTPYACIEITSIQTYFEYFSQLDWTQFLYHFRICEIILVFDQSVHSYEVQFFFENCNFLFVWRCSHHDIVVAKWIELIIVSASASQWFTEHVFFLQFLCECVSPFCTAHLHYHKILDAFGAWLDNVVGSFDLWSEAKYFSCRSQQLRGVPLPHIHRTFVSLRLLTIWSKFLTLWIDCKWVVMKIDLHFPGTHSPT